MTGLMLKLLLCVGLVMPLMQALAQPLPAPAGETSLTEPPATPAPPAFTPDLRVATDARPTDLRTLGTWWLAPTGLTPDAALAQAGTRTLPPAARHSFVVTPRDSVWAHLRLRFEPPAIPPQWRVEIPLPTLDLARLYYRTPGAPWQVRQTGDHLPMTSQAMPNLVPVLDLPVATPEVELVLELHHPSGALSAPVKLTPVNDVVTTRTNRALLTGGLLGLSGLMVLLSLMETLYARSRALGLFTLFLLLSTVAIAVHSGVAALYLWPQWGLGGHWSRFIVPCLLLAAWTHTAVWLLGFEQQGRLLSRAARAWVVLLVVVGLAMPWIGDGPAIGVLTGMLATTFVFSALLCGVAWYLRRQDAAAVLAALLIGGIGSGLTALQASGRLELSPGVWDAFPVTQVFTTGILFLAVSRRLRELLTASARSHALASHDPLTGLPNEAALRYSFKRSMHRMKFYRARALLMMVAIENLDEIGRKGGPAAQSEALVRVSARLRAALRQFDLLAKIEAERFVVLVEGPISAASARDLATHMMAGTLRMQVHGVTPRLCVAMTDAGSGDDVLDNKLAICRRLIEADSTTSATIRTDFSTAVESPAPPEIKAS